MATLTITIGTLVGTVSASNSKATALLTAYADALGTTGTNQERADAVVRALVRHMQQQGQQHRANAAMETAHAAALAEIDGLVWEA